MRPINKRQVFIGFLALFIGFLIYFLHRTPDIYFLSFIKTADNPSLLNLASLKLIGGIIPSFLHVFAFSLILGGLLACSKKGYLIICGTWLSINLLFELGQRHALAASAVIPSWFANIPVLENMQNYFLKGTFDFLDLLASLVGAVVAYFFLIFTSKRGGKNAQPN
jgi:hypothetical protein